MLIKKAFLRTIAVIIVGVVLLFSGISSGKSYDVKDPENCRLNFSVLSDAHIEGNNFTRFKVCAQAVRDIKNNKSGNDAVIFLGDNTMNGQNIENLLFHGTAAIFLKGEKVLPVMGNHDIGNGNGDYDKLQKRWFTYTEAFFDRKLDKPYYYEVIDGCYFIVLGMEAQRVYEMVVTEEQFAWLENVLRLAAESNKPAFVFSHYPMDEAEDENGNTTDRLVQMLAEYNKENDLFCFVGHTHMPLFLFWSFHNYDGFPETYLPRLTELTDNDSKEYSGSGVGLEVEVYENEVVLRGRNFYRSEWRFDESDGKMCEVTYRLKNPVPAE